MPEDSDQRDRMLEYARPAGRRQPWSGGPVVALTTLLIERLSMLAIDAYDAHRRALRAPYMRCLSNLRQIGQAMQLYAWDHRALMADGSAPLISNPALGSEVLVCRRTADRGAAGTTPEAMRADFALPGRCSYVY